jgi:hypothetical protein
MCFALLLLQIASVYPLAIIHVLGNVLTNVSLGKVAVSFTHTVKVRQPISHTTPAAVVLTRACGLPQSHSCGISACAYINVVCFCFLRQKDKTLLVAGSCLA